MKKEIELLSNFNLDLLHNFLDNEINKKKYILKKPQYGQFYEKAFKIINSREKKHLCIVWSQIEKIISNFERLVNYENIQFNHLRKEVNQYISVIKQLSKKSEHLIVLSWILPDYAKGKYLKDLTSDLGLSKNLNFINDQVANSLKKLKNISFINSKFILEQNNSDFNPKYWYAAKIPFSQKVFEVASIKIQKIIDSLQGKYIKLIIIDLDNTIWGGTIGDKGWQNIILGGHSVNGEAFQDFQKKLKALNRLGIQLAISSKNDEKVAINGITKNKNMILKKNDFATWRINWQDKAKNINEIIKELNLTNDSVLFIDDNINERERVKKAIKDIKVPNWPNDPCSYVKSLSDLDYFNYSNELTEEDLSRTRYYKQNIKRKKIKDTFVSEDKWLKSLNTKVIFKKIDRSNLQRILQLVNRTNQMNLSTRRLDQVQLNTLKNNKNNLSLSCKVEDKFGEMGIVGFFNVEIKNKKASVKDFILSCRAFGRGIEDTMIYQISKLLIKKKIFFLELKYKKTEKISHVFFF
jgi:FkbH-like protein